MSLKDDEMLMLYNYDYLLNRAIEKLPRRGDTKAYDIPQLEIEYEGEHTVVKNLNLVSERLRRDPRVVMRFLLKELGAPGALRPDNNMVIYKRISEKSVQDLYARFLENYVKCSTCKSYDTELVREGKKWYIRCLACGAITYVRPV
jgi:translation initiation factor 2 subunit 2